MSLLVYPILSSTNITLTIPSGPNVDHIMIDSTINLTYTLPIITCDRIWYIFSRLDNTPKNVTIAVSDSNIISENNGINVTS